VTILYWSVFVRHRHGFLAERGAHVGHGCHVLFLAAALLLDHKWAICNCTPERLPALSRAFEFVRLMRLIRFALALLILAWLVPEGMIDYGVMTLSYHACL